MILNRTENLVFKPVVYAIHTPPLTNVTVSVVVKDTRVGNTYLKRMLYNQSISRWVVPQPEDDVTLEQYTQSGDKKVLGWMYQDDVTQMLNSVIE